MAIRFRFSMVVHKRYAVLPLCVLCTSLAIYGIAETSRAAAPLRASTQAVAAQSAETIVPLLDGYWELMWKDSTKRLVRVQICVQQSGTRLIIHSEGSEGIRIKENSSTSGLVTLNQISFTLRPKRSSEIVFTGKLEGSILCGTTSEGLPWMAIRHFD